MELDIKERSCQDNLNNIMHYLNKRYHKHIINYADILFIKGDKLRKKRKTKRKERE
jgi:hypothetical protein